MDQRYFKYYIAKEAPHDIKKVLQKCQVQLSDSFFNFTPFTYLNKGNIYEPDENPKAFTNDIARVSS